MILDTISRLALYEAWIPGAGRVAAALDADRPQDAPCEVRVKGYDTKSDDRRRFEVHFHTIDLMIGRAGAEIIHICPAKDLTPAEALPGGADGMKLDGHPQGSAILLQEGYFVAIFPGEAHMVGGWVDGAPGRIDKWVVKAPCPEALCAGGAT